MSLANAALTAIQTGTLVFLSTWPSAVDCGRRPSDTSLVSACWGGWLDSGLSGASRTDGTGCVFSRWASRHTSLATLTIVTEPVLLGVWSCWIPSPACRPPLSATALRRVLDVPVHNAAWRTLDSGQRRQLTLDGVKRLLLREAREQPLLLIFEDLHWIDGETQALLDSLVAAWDRRACCCS
jgi:hypothetical protein